MMRLELSSTNLIYMTIAIVINDDLYNFLVGIKGSAESDF